MGILLVLVVVVALSSWLRVKEEEQKNEVKRVYCPLCGTELLDCDECCLICGFVVEVDDIW